jgi:hypothetical protein
VCVGACGSCEKWEVRTIAHSRRHHAGTSGSSPGGACTASSGETRESRDAARRTYGETSAGCACARKEGLCQLSPSTTLYARGRLRACTSPIVKTFGEEGMGMAASSASAHSLWSDDDRARLNSYWVSFVREGGAREGTAVRAWHLH